MNKAEASAIKREIADLEPGRVLRKAIERIIDKRIIASCKIKEPVYHIFSAGEFGVSHEIARNPEDLKKKAREIGRDDIVAIICGGGVMPYDEAV